MDDNPYCLSSFLSHRTVSFAHLPVSKAADGLARPRVTTHFRCERGPCTGSIHQHPRQWLLVLAAVSVGCVNAEESLSSFELKAGETQNRNIVISSALL